MAKLKEIGTKIYNSRYMIFKYVVSGGTAACVHLGTLHILDSYTNLYYVISVNIAFLIAFTVSYSLQKYWTFKDNAKGLEAQKQLVKFFVVSLFNLVLNTIIVVVLMEILIKEQPIAQWLVQFGNHITFSLLEVRPVVAAQFVAAFKVAFISFFVYRFLIFTNKQHETINSDTEGR